MGNQSSYVLGSPSDELKFKSGVKSESVPSPFGPKASTFEKLVSSPEFKNYLLSNLESSYFLSSVVNKSDDESVLLQGIHHFQNLNPDHRAATVASIKQFQRMSTAGICVSILVSLYAVCLILYS